jgi:hypothetical protein
MLQLGERPMNWPLAWDQAVGIEQRMRLLLEHVSAP